MPNGMRVPFGRNPFQPGWWSRIGSNTFHLVWGSRLGRVPLPSGSPLPPGRGTPSRWKGCPFHLGLHSRLEGLHLHHLDLQLSFLYGVMSLVVCKLQKLEPPPNGTPIPFGVGLMSFIVLKICRAKPLPNGTPIPFGTPYHIW